MDPRSDFSQPSAGPDTEFNSRLKRFVNVVEPVELSILPFQPELVGAEPDMPGLQSRIERFVLRQDARSLG